MGGRLQPKKKNEEYSKFQIWTGFFVFIRIFFLLQPPLPTSTDSFLQLQTKKHLLTTTTTTISDKETLVDDSNFYVADTRSSWRMSRADVARYILDVINDESSFRKVRAIGLLTSDSWWDVVKDQVDEFKRLFF